MKDLLYKIEQKHGRIGRSIYLNPLLNFIPKGHWCNIREKESFHSDRLILFSIKIQTRKCKEVIDVFVKVGISVCEAFDSLAKAFSELNKTGFPDLKKVLNSLKISSTEKTPKEKNFLHNPPGKKYKQYKSNKRISR